MTQVPLLGGSPSLPRFRNSSFFESLPTGVFGRLARISISVGISYLASLSARNALSSSMPNGGCPGLSA